MRRDAFQTVWVKWPPPSRSPARYALISAVLHHALKADWTRVVKLGVAVGGLVHHQ